MAKAIGIHTFIVVFWGTRSHQYLVAYTVVGLTWLFIGLFIAITVSVYTDGSNFYESPVGVSPRIVSLVLVLMACCDSIGAGSAIVTGQSNMLANMFGFGSPCSSPSSHTHRCSSGPEAISPSAQHTGGNFKCTRIRCKPLILMAGNGYLLR